MGRPTELNQVLAENIYKALRDGLSRQATAHSVGIARQTLAKWIGWGDAGDERFVDFATRCHREETVILKEMHDIVLSDARDRESRSRVDSAKWILQVRYPSDYVLRKDGVEEEPIVEANDSEEALIEIMRERLAEHDRKKTG